jgi:uncharacterized protein (DUF2147 family)
VRYRFSALVIATFAFAAPACFTPALAQDATGEWLVKDRTAKIRVINCGNALWGVVSWEKTPGGRDENNPDAALRNRPILGMPILIDMQPDEPGKWEGKIYNAENGKTYDASITLQNANVLEVEGCVMGFLCGGENWTRAQPSGQSGGARAAASDPATAPAAALCSSIGAGRAH